MEKILKLYTYIDGINDTPFPSEEYQVVTSNFRSDYKRMGGAPSITCTIMHPMCLDKLWTYGVYAKFNGERFFIKQIPSSSYDNTDARYKHELELVSERIILDNVYVYDVVDSTSVDDKPVSNSSKFVFFGTINEFVQRLNQSLRYSGLDYNIVVDEGITSEGKLVSFENQFFSNALQEIYNIFELPYYFVGKVIHVGYTSNAITRTFKYGKDESLLSIQKQNANYKIVNRATGLGSADNIPYYYPNDDEKGETALYYNGKLGIATISNPTRFRKVALGDIFKYSKGGSVEEYIIDTNDYALSFVDVQQYYDEQGSIVQGLNKWTIEFKYKFSTDVTRDFSFYINSQYLDTIDVTVHILRENGGFSKTWTNPNMIEQAFNQGDYTLTIVWNLKSDKKSSTTNDTVAREFIDKNFTVQGIISYNNYDGWLLNNNRVLLISYGINVSGSPKDGDMITFERLSYIQPQSNLMPPIYRESAGKDRFYNALNDTYISPQTNDFYEFENPYVEGQPKEHIATFDSIKPSIVGIRNAENQRIDTFLEFAYDEDDNDETYQEGHAKAGEYIHPYFFAKLRRFNGQFGFNLFDHSIDESEMVISMTSGSCGACEFIIGVTDDTQENIVQVDERGNLLRDKDGNVIRSGAPQERQNNTIDNEVWVALKKDINTFGVIMPNASNKYRPSVEDTFVILHIDLPKAYILAAEERLKDEIIKYMALNNSEKFNFSISFSRIFFAENPDILAQLDENARIQIEYDGTRYELYVSSYSYNMSKEQPLPEIRVELSDTLNVSQNALQNAISEVKRDIMSSVGSMDFLYQGLHYFLRKDVDDRARGKISSDVGFEVGNYVSGASGAIVYKDVETGQTIGEVDKLYVRMKAYFETLEIVNANTIGGKQIISPAGSIKSVGVEDVGDAYRCYFLAEQDGEKISNRWQQYDQAYSQTFNAQEGEHNNVSNTYYWRLVTKVSSNAVDFNGKKCHYIELSKTDYDKGSDIPNVGDIINQRGSRTDVDRMNFIEQSSVDAFSPNITLFHGVNSYSLDGKEYVSYGVDKSTNKAFMNVYGEMYVGDRQGGSYMRYTQENGLEISGTLSVGTKLGDTPLKDLISASSPEGYHEFVEKVTQDIEELQQQIDGSIESYFYQYHPTLENYPASEWNTKEEKDAHLNDTFTSLVDGRSWRWTVLDGVYGWTEITDSATTKALALAGQAQDTADGKRRVFVDTPKPPYDKGDLWSRGSDYPLMICVNPKAKNQTYEVSDFDYADNNAKLKEEMQDLVNDTKDDLNNAIGQATEAANKYADQGISAAEQAINTSINALNQAKANVSDVYSKAEADGKISESETKAINAAKAQADAAIALSETTIKAYADGVVDEEEAARIKQAQENLEAAKKYADEAAQAVEDEINNNYGYLSQALNKAPQTEVNQGLVLTSLIQMRNTSSSIMSGLNGLYGTKKEKSIATWWGGDMHDLEDYYSWNGTEWVVKSNVTVPTNIPSGLIRFDGTGYLAKGKFWWDKEGKIYADPTALFLMFDVEDEAQSLSSTILAMRDKQAEFEDMWGIKTDSNGNKYLYSKYHIATQGGVTMYTGTDSLNLPSIYEGIPIDGSTIYWDNGVLKAKGSGGSISGQITFKDIANVGNWADSVADVDRIMYQAAGSSNWVAKSLSSIGGVSGDYLPLSGGKLNGVLTIASSKSSPNTILNLGSGHDTKGDYVYLDLNVNGALENNLVLREDDAYVDGKLILTESNYFQYALPLTGGDLNGDLVLPNMKSLKAYDSKGGAMSLVYTYYNDIHFAVDSNSKGYTTYINGTNIILRYGSTAKNGIKLDSAGNVGIGTTNPENKLNVVGSSGWTSRMISSNSVVSLANNDGYGLFVGTTQTSSSYYLLALRYGQTSLGSGGSVAMQVNANGNVGIGTSSIDYKLHVNGTLGATTIYQNGTSLANTYLPLTGGTISASSGDPLTIQNNGGQNVRLVIKNQSYIVSTVGKYSDYTYLSNLKNGSTVSELRLFDSGIAHLNGNTIWHSGNDGSGSGLDADLLDGKHANTSQKPFNSIPTIGGDGVMEIGKYIDFHADNTTDSDYSTRITCGGNYSNVITLPSSTGTLALTSSNVASATYATTAGSCSGNAASASKVNSALSWSGYSSGSFDGSSSKSISIPSNTNQLTNGAGFITANLGSTKLYWHNDSNHYYISSPATTDSAILQYTAYGGHKFTGGNVGIGTDPSSSYKLYVNGTMYGDLEMKTPRTIWGQSFDGTKNISGVLSGVSAVITSGEYGIYKASSFTNGLTDNDIAYYANIHSFYGGNVGIGTNSPSYKLDVNGTAAFGTTSSCDVWLKRTNGSSYINAAKSLMFTVNNSSSNYALRIADNKYITMYSYVGIGTEDPNYKLHVNNGDIATNQYIRVLAWTGYGSGSCNMWYDGTNTRLDMSSGLKVASNILAGGGITMYSQRSLKNVIDERGLSLNELSIIKPTRYTWKDGRDNRLHIGGIADDIQQVLPEVVYKTSEGILTMDYGNAAFAVASSLIQPVVDHEKRISMLERENKELRQEVERLKSA